VRRVGVMRTTQRAVWFLIGIASLAMAPRDAGATATTHVWSPATDVQPFRTVHVTEDLYVPDGRGAAGERLPSVTNLGLTAGVLPWRNLNLEIGVDHKSGFGALDAYPLYFNAKLGVPEGSFSPALPALAVGVFDAGTRSDVTDADVVYAAAAKTIGRLGRLSVGWFSGRDRLLVDADGQADNSGIMLAWERTMSEISDRLWLCVDYMGTKSAYGTLSFGGSWKFADNVALLAGYVVQNESRLFPNMVTIQADIDFGLGGGGQ
jgi:hypothetical protein